MSKQNEMIVVDRIQDRIHTIRGLQVMQDNDLAEIYEVETKTFNRAVKRNIDRFPDPFRFQLTKEEYENLRSQIVTSSAGKPLRCQNGTLKDSYEDSLRSRSVTLKTGGGRGQHRKYLPYVFTEQGVSMLSAVLRSETAVKVSIKIINAFVEMRRFIQNNANVFAQLNLVERRQIVFESETEKNFEKVFQALQSAELPKQGIFFNGQIFDAYSFTSNLIRKAKVSIKLVDNYVDDTVLTLLGKRKKGVAVIIYTKNISKQLKLDLEKHNAQYPGVEIKKLSQSHDRFLIIDDLQLYHFGASLKDLGKKWFAFSRMDSITADILARLRQVES